MKKWLIGLIPAALVVILLGYIAGSHVVPQSVQDNFANVAEPPAGIASPPDDPAADAIPEQPANSGLSVNTSDAAASGAEDAPPATRTAGVDQPAASDNADDDSDAQAQAQHEIAKAVRRATEKALDSGEPAHWHKDGLTGDVTVSEAEDEPAGTCRTVSASIGDDDDRRQSSDHVWCQASDSGEWAPQ